MFTLKQAQSIGCIDYGNNNFFEIMKDSDGTIGLMSHDEPPEENSDGTFSGEADTVEEFVDSVSDRPDFPEIMKELLSIISK
jgi:hypothetical protein